MSEFQQNNPNGIIKLIAPITYIVTDVDYIEVDTSSGGLTTIILQQIFYTNPAKKLFINDISNNASVGNIVIQASGSNLINNAPILVLSDNGIAAQIVISDKNRFIANLSNDNGGGGGGTVTGASNGLNLLGTIVELGGLLTKPAVITADNTNLLSITDDWGTMFKTRDANKNFFISDFGNPILINSTLVFSFVSDSGTSFIDSTIVYNFGGANTYNMAIDIFSVGDYNTFNNSYQTQNIGRGNSFTIVSNGHIFGDFNTLNSCAGVNVFGNNNTISNKANQFYLGNNNKNLVIDNNGNVGIGTTSPIQILHIYKSGFNQANVLVESDTHTANLVLSSFKNGYGTSGGSNILFNSVGVNYGNISTISANTSFAINALNYYSLNLSANSTNNYVNIGGAYGDGISIATDNAIRLFINKAGNIGIGGFHLYDNPTARLHVKGDADAGTYALKVNSLNNPLLYVRNDGWVNINNANNAGLLEKLSVDGHIVINHSTSAYATIHFFTTGGGAGSIRAFADRLETSADRHVFLKKNGSGLLDINAYGSLESSFKGNVGIGGNFNPMARLHVKGVDNTSGNFALKVDNSASVSSPLLYVRNDGLISTKVVQPAYGTLVSGDLYYDTAANILANGDLVVGRKV